MCVCAHHGDRELENRDKEQCLQRLTQVFAHGPHDTILHLSDPPIVLTSASPGDVGGQLLRLPSQIFLGLPELISMGRRLSYYSLVTWPAVLVRKVTTPDLRGMQSHACARTQTSHPENAHPCWGPPLTGHNWRPLTNPEPEQGCSPIWGVSCCAVVILLRVARRKTEADTQCQHKGLTAT